MAARVLGKVVRRVDSPVMDRMAIKVACLVVDRAQARVPHRAMDKVTISKVPDKAVS